MVLPKRVEDIMKVGDLVRCNVTKAANTLGVVTKVVKGNPQRYIQDDVYVLHRRENISRWSASRLEVISESR